jgi:hypothetical protein
MVLDEGVIDHSDGVGGGESKTAAAGIGLRQNVGERIAGQ